MPLFTLVVWFYYIDTRDVVYRDASQMVRGFCYYHVNVMEQLGSHRFITTNTFMCIAYNVTHSGMKKKKS